MNNQTKIKHLLEQHVILSRIIRESNKIKTTQGTLTVIQFCLLSEISSQKAAFSSDKFSKRYRRTQSSTSSIMSHMIKKGYLSSIVEGLDRRKHTFGLTPKGQQIFDSASDIISAQMLEEHSLLLDQLGVSSTR